MAHIIMVYKGEDNNRDKIISTKLQITMSNDIVSVIGIISLSLLGTKSKGVVLLGYIDIIR